LTLHPGWFLSI
jgi:proteasome assembly chaperone 4